MIKHVIQNIKTKEYVRYIWDNGIVDYTHDLELAFLWHDQLMAGERVVSNKIPQGKVRHVLVSTQLIADVP